MSSFNTFTFERVLSRLNGFIDELYLLNEIKEVPSVDICHYYNIKNDFYHSVDILTAADVGDSIYFSKLFKKFTKEKILTSTEDQQALEKESTKYYSLMKEHSVSGYAHASPKGYREYLKFTISEMYKAYMKMKKDGLSDAEIYAKFGKEFGADIDIHSVETLLFVKYIRPESENIQNGTLEVDEAIDKTYKEIFDLLSKAEQESDVLSAENPALDETLDKLMFKPFIKFHEKELEYLKERASKNSEVLWSLRG